MLNRIDRRPAAITSLGGLVNNTPIATFTSVSSGSYETVLNITGRGIFCYLALANVDGCKITVDGTEIYNDTTTVGSAAITIMGVKGVGTGTAHGGMFSIPFDSTLLVEVRPTGAAANCAYTTYVEVV